MRKIGSPRVWKSKTTDLGKGISGGGAEKATKRARDLNVIRRRGDRSSFSNGGLDAGRNNHRLAVQTSTLQHRIPFFLFSRETHSIMCFQ